MARPTAEPELLAPAPMSYRRDTSLLQRAGIDLVLVDVGASFEPFKPFQPLLGVATYVGFDPDQREIKKRRGNHLHRYIIINKAVVPDAAAKKVRFFLTKHPACSSTLRPNRNALKHYLGSHRFEVVDEVQADVISFGDALEDLGLDRIDWLKLDTQGTDLRLFESIQPRIAEAIMAVDVEPGFDQYYEGEDTFANLHGRMTEAGFWLADLDLGFGIRLPAHVLGKEVATQGKFGRLISEFGLKGSPTAARARYLRTLEWLDRRAAGREAYLRLWACAYFSGNYPYALHVLHMCAGCRPETEELVALRAATVRRLRNSALRAMPRLAAKLNWRNIRRFLTKDY